ncbi:MAG: hypothetical protein VB055_06155 [Oscillospiraceae bacterium]|nr:hypothetical protein [Oscillospiraceae bacterium]
MIEKTVLDYLSASLSLPVKMEVPENPPEEFLVVEKTGSDVSNHIKRATIAVQSYAGSLYRAACINEDVKAATENLVALPEISKASLNSDYNFPDTQTKKYRYQAVFDIYHF